MLDKIKVNRQKPISITTREHKVLEGRRLRYQEITGDKGDWGKFLHTISAIGLAALGIYRLAKAVERSEQFATVKCPSCDGVFPIALANEQANIAQVPVHTAEPSSW